MFGSGQTSTLETGIQGDEKEGLNLPRNTLFILTFEFYSETSIQLFKMICCFSIGDQMYLANDNMGEVVVSTKEEPDVSFKQFG